MEVNSENVKIKEKDCERWSWTYCEMCAFQEASLKTKGLSSRLYVHLGRLQQRKQLLQIALLGLICLS